MIGNKIGPAHLRRNRNLPEASALSALLALAVAGPDLGVLALNRGRNLLAPSRRLAVTRSRVAALHDGRRAGLLLPAGAVLVVNSFNASRFLAAGRVHPRLVPQAVGRAGILHALRNTLIVAPLATTSRRSSARHRPSPCTLHPTGCRRTALSADLHPRW